MKNLEYRSCTAVVTTEKPGIAYVFCFKQLTIYAENMGSVYATVK